MTARKPDTFRDGLWLGAVGVLLAISIANYAGITPEEAHRFGVFIAAILLGADLLFKILVAIRLYIDDRSDRKRHHD